MFQHLHESLLCVCRSSCEHPSSSLLSSFWASISVSVSFGAQDGYKTVLLDIWKLRPFHSQRPRRLLLTSWRAACAALGLTAMTAAVKVALAAEKWLLLLHPHKVQRVFIYELSITAAEVRPTNRAAALVFQHFLPNVVTMLQWRGSNLQQGEGPTVAPTTTSGFVELLSSVGSY